jgi:hypothetical protein
MSRATPASTAVPPCTSATIVSTASTPSRAPRSCSVAWLTAPTAFVVDVGSDARHAMAERDARSSLARGITARSDSVQAFQNLRHPGPADAEIAGERSPTLEAAGIDQRLVIPGSEGNINAPRALAPPPLRPVPRPSRPQPRTPSPRWSRRHSAHQQIFLRHRNACDVIPLCRRLLGGPVSATTWR